MNEEMSPKKSEAGLLEVPTEFGEFQEWYTTLAARYNTFEMLNGRDDRCKWEKDTEAAFHPEGVERWDDQERYEYLEALGRFRSIVDANILQSNGGVHFPGPFYGECRRISSKLGEHRADGIKNYTDFVGAYVALSSNSNTANEESHKLQGQFKSAADVFMRNGDTTARDRLVNPFHLKSGTELAFYDKGEAKIKFHVIDVVDIDNDTGHVSIQGNKRDLADVNADLAKGTLMLRDGTNFFGGIDRLRERIRHCRAGARFIYESKGVFDDAVDRRTLVCLGANIEELEVVYGLSYLAFMFHAPENAPLVSASFRDEVSGRVFENMDIRKFNARGITLRAE